jgi:hypothetical protein
MTDGKHETEYEVINKVIDGIEKEPTVEPRKVGDVCKECWMEDSKYVEVVRCKDCKHFISFNGERAKVNTDKSGWCDINDYSVRSDDYCSYGERRSE